MRSQGALRAGRKVAAVWALCTAATMAGCCGACPRPDADCFYAAFSARVSHGRSAPPPAGSTATSPPAPPSTDPEFIPLSASSWNGGGGDSGGDGSNGTDDGGGDATAVTTAGTTWSWSSYHSHEAMLTFLTRLVNASGGACRLEWLSPTSVEGRHMPAVVLGAEEEGEEEGVGAGGGEGVARDLCRLPKPSFTWIGNMHGDETANRELLLRLAAGGCSGELAAADGRWQEVLGGTVVRIIPSMNPDGFARRRRLNSRNVDLNRNFLTPAFPYAPPAVDQALAVVAGVQRRESKYPAAASWALVGNFSLQPEAQAVASYLSYTLPDLSANLHGGALVANYPLDACDTLGTKRACPTHDEPLPQLLAAAYAGSQPGMARDAAAPFRSGTVQGAAWYPVLGSLQDWVYHTLGRLHLTLELHRIKDPPAAALPALWEANRSPMLRLMQLAHMGLRGRVVDAATLGSLSANVTVVLPPGVRGTAADATRRHGYFFKAMAPGIEYEFFVQPYDPREPGASYEAVSFRAALPPTLHRGAVVAAMSGEGQEPGGFSLRDLTVERVLLALRSNTSTSVKK